MEKIISFKEIREVISENHTVDKYGDFTPLDFYNVVFPASTHIQFKLGYFSTKAISVLASGFARFIIDGGEIELMINHFLSQEDKDLLLDQGVLSEVDKFLIGSTLNEKELEEFHDYLIDCKDHFFNCLKYLINETEQLQIIPVTCLGGEMSHYKQALFTDKYGDKIGINGSSNFTQNGILENGESIEVFCSWDGAKDLQRINSLATELDLIFNQEAGDRFSYLSEGDFKNKIEVIAAEKSIYELLEDEQELAEKTEKYSKIRTRLNKYRANLKQQSKEILKEKNKPRFPFESPRDYQIEAYNNWVGRGKKGVFAMATGTGKTLTSLNCLLNEYKKTGYYKAVICVPTISLATQWEQECKKFNFKENLIIVNSKKKWSGEFDFISAASTFGSSLSFVIIVTYSSLTSNKFLTFFKDLPKDVLFIADEAHNLGSYTCRKLLPTIKFDKRIGLSATPIRVYDESGTKEILSFFCENQTNYCFSFDIQTAIKNGYLCEYLYFPRLVSLTVDEFKAYRDVTLKLMRFFDAKTKTYKNCKEVEILLLERKRIIHKAFNKLEVFKNILHEVYIKNGHLKYTLIYTPEGKPANYEYARKDNYEENQEDLKLIDLYTNEVHKIDSNICAVKFTSDTRNRNSVLKDFASSKIQVLTSMKCLDEGVDVPRAELAIFCSSTGNPRQFIQRRGRVLRKAIDKDFAYIYDLVVVPEISNETESTFNVEKSLIKTELRRVHEFAKSSLNYTETHSVLNPVLEAYEINLFDL